MDNLDYKTVENLLMDTEMPFSVKLKSLGFKEQIVHNQGGKDAMLVLGNIYTHPSGLIVGIEAAMNYDEVKHCYEKPTPFYNVDIWHGMAPLYASNGCYLYDKAVKCAEKALCGLVEQGILEMDVIDLPAGSIIK